MSILQQEIYKFVNVWNHHKIHKQSSQSNSVSEWSWLLYTHFFSDVKQCNFISDTEILAELQETTADWDKKFFTLKIKNFTN